MSQIILDNIQNNETVYHRFVIVHGRVTSNNSHTSAFVTVKHFADTFPQQYWVVTDSYFKALIHVVPGENVVLFQTDNGSELSLRLNYQVLNDNPFYRIGFVVGRDSDLTFDAPYGMKNDLDEAIRKLRCAAYLWQAFTAECMYRNGFGRRTFRLEENIQPDTMSCQSAWGTERLTASIHVLRSDKTAEEIRSTPPDQLFHVAGNAVDKLGLPEPWHYICMFLDTRYDPSSKEVRGHVALGGGTDMHKLGVFGSHSLHSFPSAIEYVIPVFSDARRIPDYLANDANESSTVWECANIGIGAILHELGHTLGCPHQPDGIMLRSYPIFNRSFTTRESECVRTGSKGLAPILPKDECSWHYLDLLRFYYHPLFRLPSDQQYPSDVETSYYVSGDQIVFTNDTGIFLVEIEYNGQTKGWKIFNPPLDKAAFTDAEIRSLSSSDSGQDYRVRVLARNYKTMDINNVPEIIRNAKISTDFGDAYRSERFGLRGCNGNELNNLLFSPEEKITKVRVHCGLALDGIEVFFGSNSALLGNRGGSPHDFDTDGSNIAGFLIRSGAWVDGISIILENGNTSPFFGNANGGGQKLYKIPENSRLVGFYGTLAGFMDSVGFFIQ
ncbi:metallopeptidase [Schizosaccharomyces octosporus yFS286]|uniref:Metallopeptidase n=1 Tax=Schizosaccharomyces octosporus (strain yFS286) TaxID=483514 RepID=S9PSW5_SCHOY|nr:metallopeptidase [Schizosaccharomyces octosporus yFS286]EPX70573.1 metallopeptidase [Schizosaccharomyces octosporus yFS286]